MAHSRTTAPRQLTRDRADQRVVAEKTWAGAVAKRRVKAPDKSRPRARLLIKHPTIDPSTITKLIGIDPFSCSKVGDQRRLPNGDLLPGTYKETTWTLDFPNLEHESLGTMATSAINSLPLHSELWAMLRNSGGKVCLILAIVGSKYQGDELGAELVGRLAAMGIALGLEIYAVPQN